MFDFVSFKNDLKKLISYQSIHGEKTSSAPFGEQNKLALNFFLSLAEKMGFQTINYDNYAGEVIFGEGQEIGVIGHLDVVPVSNIGWNSNPFVLTEKDGFLYGRGVSDDKGPTLLNLYALKELKDNGIKPNCKFRLFVGCNEEDGWEDIEYLKTKTTMPEYGYSPDGNFPLSYAEKGVFQVRFSFPKFKNFSNIKGGSAINAVCDYASVESLLPINNVLLKTLSLSSDGNKIESFGKAAHGSMPHLGKNAIKPLLQYLASMGEDTENIVKFLFDDALGLSKLENEQGTVTFSPNVIFEDENKVFITCDCRIPAPFNFEDIKNVIDQFGFDYSLLPHTHPPVCVAKDGFFVQTLLSAYNSVTGENKQPISMCGSTFARAFNKGCAFGMDFLTYETNIHDANERVKISDLATAYEIYYTALKSLAERE